MSDLDKRRVHDEAQRQVTRYGEAVNRYLGAVGYRPRGPEPAVRGPVPRTGVVVVGVDETPTSYMAVDHAAIEAELRGWDLRIVHVQRPGEPGDLGDRLLERLTDRVHACSPTVVVTSRMVVGAAAPLLLSDAHDASLVVVGHRHNAAGTAFGLSVSDRVAGHATCPVLVVRVPGWSPGPDFGARPVTVGADGTPAAAKLIGFAVGEAQVRGCEVQVVHAASAPGALRDHLETIQGVGVHHRFVTRDPAAALLTASEKSAALVVGRRGPGGFAAALLGSVSRSMVQRAHCPVFLIS